MRGRGPSSLTLAAALGLVATVAVVRVAAAETVVLIDPPPALEAAVRSSLAPWRIEVLVVGRDAGAPEALAAAQQAGFVAWREGGELVFWDTARAQKERRPMPARLDEAGAAALALSIKTWMRLGPPPTDPPPPADPPPPDAPPPDPTPPPPEPVVVAPAPSPRRDRIHADLGLGLRQNLGEHGGVGARAAIAFLYAIDPVEVGVAVETGLAYDYPDAGGARWRHHTVAGQVRWPFGDPARLAVVPTASLGLVLSSASGTGGPPQNMTFAMSGTSLWLDGGVLLARRWGAVSAGIDLGLGVVLTRQELQERSTKLTVPAHIEPRGLLRVGLSLF